MDLSDIISDTFHVDDKQTVKIHLRVQQRNARQRLTTVAGFTNDTDLKNLVKQIKKILCCSGAVVDDPGSTDKILQFTGDQRQKIADFLVEKKIVEKKDIIIHGY